MADNEINKVSINSESKYLNVSFPNNNSKTAAAIVHKTVLGDAVQQSQDAGETETTFDFTGKNANATALDETLTGGITYGASGKYSAVFGGKAAAMGKRSMAVGTTTIAKGDYSHAEGENSVSYGLTSHAEGVGTLASGKRSHSEGAYTVARGDNSHAEGEYTEANSYGSHTEGHKTYSLDKLAVPSGGSSSESGGSSSSTPSGGGEATEKTPDDTLGGYSNAQGDNTQTLGYASHSEGVGSRAWGHFSHAEGLNTVAGELIESGGYYKVDGRASHAEGHSTAASGEYSHAEGDETIASGKASHAEGYRTSASGKYSKASGTGVAASGENSVAEGSNTKASGWAARAGGTNTEASGGNSTAMGSATIASGVNSLTSGSNTKAINENMVAFGQFNSAESDTLFAIGNGSSEADRKNAFEVLSDGDATIQKKLTVGENLSVTSGILSTPNLTVSTKGGFLYSNIDSGTTNVARSVWFASADSAGTVTNGTPVVSDDFKYNPSTKTLTVANLEGNASAATTASTVMVSSSSSKQLLLGVTGASGNQSCYANDKVYITNGAMNAVSYNATSDRRLKENIVDYTCEKSILDLPIKKFDFIEGLKNQIGCIAQDLQEICPEIVHEGDDGYLSIQESKIVYLLLEEVKKLREEVNELKGAK